MNIDHPPDFLFKIFKKERFQDLIDSRCLYLANPVDDFNDPYDCIQGIDIPHSSRDAIRQAFINECRLRRINLSRQQLEDLADPKNLRDLNEHYRSAGQSVVRSMGVMCLTEQVDSFPMWAHYGDNHKGVAVKFRTAYLPHDNYYLWPVTYVNRFPTLDEWQENELQIFRDNKPFLKMLLCRKCVQWEPEREWRLISMSHPIENRKIEFRSELIESIYFGAMVADDDIKELQLLMRERHFEVKLFRLHVDASSYNLTQIELNYF